MATRPESEVLRSGCLGAAMLGVLGVGGNPLHQVSLSSIMASPCWAIGPAPLPPRASGGMDKPPPCCSSQGSTPLSAFGGAAAPSQPLPS